MECRLGHVVTFGLAVSIVGCTSDLSPRQRAVPTGAARSAIVGSAAGAVRHVHQPIADRYIVVLRAGTARDPAAVRGVASTLASSVGGRLVAVYTTGLQGMAVAMSSAQAETLAADPRVEFVEEDAVVRASDVQSAAPSGVDRLDQRYLPLDGAYRHDETGAGVHAYVLDTGIRATHVEFGGRVSLDFTAVDDGYGASDCHGHGTHVAALLGGATYGVAKQVTLHSVRVLDCDGMGSVSGVLSAIDWVNANATRPALVNMSLGGMVSSSEDDAVTKSISAGISYVIAAGNDSGDACGTSPAHVPAALTVSALDGSDARAGFANFGSCVDLFAPGVDLLSAWNTDDTATRTLSGTSMATPLVAGIAALYLESTPAASPADVTSALLGNATPISVADAGPRSPHRVAYAAPLAPPADTTPPLVALSAPSTTTTASTDALSGATTGLAGTVTVTANATDDTSVHHVEFYLDDEFLGTSATSPYALTWDTTRYASGSRRLTARAFDEAANVTTSTEVDVTLANPGNAAYDPGYAVPVCRNVASQCDTTSLVDGRAIDEPNAPNNLAASPCGDGPGGYYHRDQSIDAVRVRRLDGTALATGKAVEVQVRMWAYGTYTPVSLLLATNPDAPDWNVVATLYPTASGPQVLTQLVVLPASPLQALRVTVEESGWGDTCPIGDNDEADDLVFAVGAPEPDSTPPSVVLTAPTAGATLAGVASLRVDASDNMGVTAVEYFAGGQLVARSEIAPFDSGWDTRGTADGSYSLSARALDYAGNVAWSGSVAVTVRNDTQAPTTAITSPASGASVRGRITIAATASDNVGVTQVAFYDGNALIGTDTTAPYAVTWDTTYLTRTTHTLTTRASDASGNVGVSAPVYVTVH